MSTPQNAQYLGPCYIVGATTHETSSSVPYLIIKPPPVKVSEESASEFTNILENWEGKIATTNDLTVIHNIINELKIRGIVCKNGPQTHAEKVYKKALQKKYYLERKNGLR